MKQKNEYVNDIQKIDAIENNKEFYWKRTGRCCWKKCQAACCRFKCSIIVDRKKKQNYRLSDYPDNKNGIIRLIKGLEVLLQPKLCLHITFDGKCALHNKKTQPRVCKYFPMYPGDGMYKVLSGVCGYKFKKVKNIRYDKNKEGEKVEF